MTLHPMFDHIKQSNLIEQVDDPDEIKVGLSIWDYLMEDESPITEELVLFLHKALMKNLLHARYRGVYRTSWVRVGNRICPDPLKVPGMMRNWLRDVNEQIGLTPKELHIEFEKIHPFIDGNGRVGRMLMWYHQYLLNQEPTLIKYENRVEYYNWFEDDEYKTIMTNLYLDILRKEE